ncbi:MAG: TIGR03564 family F420-dependent LLM class oxidoreductase [Acidimicrobiia bacterium]|jgi:F420-dependent oxidoreductase-like protein|nr:TIGR03564 family F420-dependent LLM class oxidoreductase [Acidimicrobiia bacterium]
MRYGLIVDTARPVAAIVEEVRGLAAAGLHSVATSQIFGYDALTLLAVVGAAVPDIELVTAVVPTYPRHPIALAAQALTVQAVTGGRLTLGIGLSHQVVVEGVYGLSYDRPARHMREYLSVLGPLLRGEQVAFEGETMRVATMGPLEVGAPAPPVLVAALGPVMLGLAGSLADGTSTWMTGPATVDAHITPTITAAAEAVGRSRPRVSVGLPVCVTHDPDAARSRADTVFAIYGRLPSYRAMLDREGAAGPGDVAVVGDEESVAAQLRALAEVGATECTAAPFGSAEERARTVALVTGLAVGTPPRPRD